MLIDITVVLNDTKSTDEVVSIISDYVEKQGSII
jgi:ribosomal protein L30/L7E